MTDPYAIKPTDRVGDVVRPDQGQVPLDVWRRTLDADGQPTGYLKRERMRTLLEVAADLTNRIDVVVCEKCGQEWPRRPNDYSSTHKGCGGDTYWFIDEYFSGPGSIPEDTPVPHDFRWIACYPVTGGSEGHYVHIDFVIPEQGSRERGWGCRLLRLALGKTFRGMDHAAEMARRCARLLGA